MVRELHLIVAGDLLVVPHPSKVHGHLAEHFKDGGLPIGKPRVYVGAQLVEALLHVISHCLWLVVSLIAAKKLVLLQNHGQAVGVGQCGQLLAYPGAINGGHVWDGLCQRCAQLGGDHRQLSGAPRDRAGGARGAHHHTALLLNHLATT